MGWGVEKVFDLFRVGGGYQHENGEGSAVGKASLAAVASFEEEVWNGYDLVPARSLTGFVEAEGNCSRKNCQAGANLGIALVPGVLGAWFVPKAGFLHDFGDGHNEVQAGIELDVLDPVSPLTELWGAQLQVGRDLNDQSFTVTISLVVGGSATLAIQQRN
ncbi:MAG TPA: hypothetical protein VLJ37_04435 [bacterium]|nr:hypothetical protein [bacterium]